MVENTIVCTDLKIYLKYDFVGPSLSQESSSKPLGIMSLMILAFYKMNS